VSGALIGRRRRERDDELDEVRREVFILSFGEGGDVYSVGWVSGGRKGARCIKAGLNGLLRWRSWIGTLCFRLVPEEA
jgi:hypothetical protein